MTYVMSKLISNDNGAPFEDLGITEDMFMPLDEMVNKPITIIGYKNYVKDDSDGVFIAFEYGGDLRYVATHSVGLVKTFQNEEVQKILDEGHPISAKVVEKKSKKTGRMYKCFETEE